MTGKVNYLEEIKRHKENITGRDWITQNCGDEVIKSVEDAGQPIWVQYYDLLDQRFVKCLKLDDQIYDKVDIDTHNNLEYIMCIGSYPYSINLLWSFDGLWDSYKFCEWNINLMEYALCIAEGSQNFTDRELLQTWLASIKHFLLRINDNFSKIDRINRQELDDHAYSPLVGSEIWNSVSQHFAAIMKVGTAEDWQYKQIQKAIKIQRRNLREVKDQILMEAV